MSPSPRRPVEPHVSQLSNAEFVTLVLVLGAGIVATALFLSWVYQSRGILAPGTVPTRTPPASDPDYVAPPDGT